MLAEHNRLTVDRSKATEKIKQIEESFGGTQELMSKLTQLDHCQIARSYQAQSKSPLDVVAENQKKRDGDGYDSFDADFNNGASDEDQKMDSSGRQARKHVKNPP